MALLPTFPVFSENDSSVTNLQQLAYAVAFLSDADIFPVYHAFDQSDTNSITSGSWHTIPAGDIAYDNDGQAGSAGAFIVTTVTQGVYLFEGCADFSSGTAITVQVSFLITGGGNNPHIAGAATKRFGYRSSESPASASGDTVLCASDYTPFPLYPLDTVAFQLQVSTTCNQIPLSNTSYVVGRFVTNFTNRWVSYAI